MLRTIAITALLALVFISGIPLAGFAAPADDEEEGQVESAAVAGSPHIHVEIIEDCSYTDYWGTSNDEAGIRMLKLIRVYDEKGRIVSETRFRHGLPDSFGANYYGDTIATNERVWISRDKSDKGSSFSVTAKLAGAENVVQNRLMVLPDDPFVKSARAFFDYAPDGRSCQTKYYMLDGNLLAESKMEFNENGDETLVERNMYDADSGKNRHSRTVYEYFAPGKLSRRTSYYEGRDKPSTDAYFYSRSGVLKRSIRIYHEDGATRRTRTDYDDAGREYRVFTTGENGIEHLDKETHYDQYGNVTEWTTFTDDDPPQILGWGKGEYEYDEYGNWTLCKSYSSCVDSLRDDFLLDGYYRTLTYYGDEN